MTATTLIPRLSTLACGVLLCLGAGVDPARNAPPPASPRFRPPTGALFADDFHAAVLTGWRADREGVWTLSRGMLRADLPDNRQEHSMIFAGDTTWTDYALDVDVCGMRGVDKGIAVRVRGTVGLGIDLRGPGYHDVRLQMNEWPLGRANIDNGNGVWHHLRMEVRGARCRVLVNGAELIGRRIPLRLPPTGGIALAAYTGGVGECTVYYDNVVVTSLDSSADR